MNVSQMIESAKPGVGSLALPPGSERFEDTGRSAAAPAQTADGVSFRAWGAPGGGCAPLPIWGGPETNGFTPGDPSDTTGTQTALPGSDGSGSSGAQGGFFGVISGLIKQIDTYLNSIAGETTAEGAGSQNVANATFSSTGDPHLAETGTLVDGSGNGSPIARRFDSMTSHDNLLSSQDFDGGYRVSTTVSAANDKGVTTNAAATVHANSGMDTVTMNEDGSYAIASGGNSVSIDPGQTIALEGGESVTRNTDGSLTVADRNTYGGTISTTLAAKGGGVDVTASVTNANVGGDIASGTANAPAAIADPTDLAQPYTEMQPSGFA